MPGLVTFTLGRCDKLTERLQLVTEGEELEEESSRALEDGSLGGGAIISRGRLRPKGGRKVSDAVSAEYPTVYRT